MGLPKKIGSIKTSGETTGFGVRKMSSLFTRITNVTHQPTWLHWFSFQPGPDLSCYCFSRSFFPPIQGQPSLKHSPGGYVFAFRRQKTSMGQRLRGIFPCSSTMSQLRIPGSQWSPAGAISNRLPLQKQVLERHRRKNLRTAQKAADKSQDTHRVSKVHIWNAQSHCKTQSHKARIWLLPPTSPQSGKM